MIIETFIGALAALMLGKAAIEGVEEFDGPAMPVVLTAVAVTFGGVGVVLLVKTLYLVLVA